MPSRIVKFHSLWSESSIAPRSPSVTLLESQASPGITSARISQPQD